MWVKVHNRSDAPAPYTMLRFYLSTDATITRSDTQVATRWTVLGINSHDKERATVAPRPRRTTVAGCRWGKCHRA